MTLHGLRGWMVVALLTVGCQPPPPTWDEWLAAGTPFWGVDLTCELPQQPDDQFEYAAGRWAVHFFEDMDGCGSGAMGFSYGTLLLDDGGCVEPAVLDAGTGIDILAATSVQGRVRSAVFVLDRDGVVDAVVETERSDGSGSECRRGALLPRSEFDHPD